MHDLVGRLQPVRGRGGKGIRGRGVKPSPGGDGWFRVDPYCRRVLRGVWKLWTRGVRLGTVVITGMGGSGLTAAEKGPCERE